MRTKVYGRARPPRESYIFAAMLVKCGRSCQSAHRCARPTPRLRSRCTCEYTAVSACHWPLPPRNFRESGHFLVDRILFPLFCVPSWNALPRRADRINGFTRFWLLLYCSLLGRPLKRAGTLEWDYGSVCYARSYWWDDEADCKLVRVEA